MVLLPIDATMCVVNAPRLAPIWHSCGLPGSATKLASMEVMPGSLQDASSVTVAAVACARGELHGCCGVLACT